MKDTERPAWPEEVPNGVRSSLRAVQQARTKTPGAGWLQALLVEGPLEKAMQPSPKWGRCIDIEVREKEKEKEDAADDVTSNAGGGEASLQLRAGEAVPPNRPNDPSDGYLYGYSTEHHATWRWSLRSKGNQSNNEFANDI